MDLLKTETRRYRVTVNDVTREGTEVNYTFTLSVGIVAKITVECLNSSGDVIVRAFKEHKVTGGENNVSISLKNDGNEIINGGVTYSYGDAAAGGTVTGFPPSIKVAVGEKFTVTGNSNSITWDYGTFVEWKANVALTAEGGNQIQAGGTVPAGTYIMPSQNVILTAQWQKYKYTITYDSNSPAAGATVSSVTNLPQTDALTQVTLAAPTVTNNPVTVGVDKKNYTFLHWKDTSDGDKTYSAGSQITLTKNMTLEAVWSDKDVYTITFNPGSTPSSTVNGMQSTPLSVINGETSQTWINPTAAGYTFTGWKVTDSTGSEINPNAGTITSYAPTQNVTFTAQWTVIPYSISYDINGGAFLPDGFGLPPVGLLNTDFNITTTNITLRDNTSFAKAGYTFANWETASGDDITGKSASELIALMGSGSTTLAVRAKWQEMATLYVGGTGANDTTNDGSQTKPFATLQKAFDVVATLTASTQRTITVQSALTDTAVTMTGGTITLNLNGNTITGTRAASVIRINGGSLTLDGNGTITGGGKSSSGGSGGGVYVVGGSFTMNSGTISGNSITATVSNAAGYGGGVCVASGATFTMNDGTISGNDATFGGGVYNNNGTFTMTGGTISGNTAEKGAGVCVASGATFTMSGGKISANECDPNVARGVTSATEGGGVYVSGGSFTMTEGTIGGSTAAEANTAENGGGVYVASGTFEMSGGTISGNSVTAASPNTAKGGGVHVANGANFTLNGGTISSNETSHYGGGIYIATGGIFDMYSGSTISDNQANGGGFFAGGVMCYGTFTMYGGVIMGNTTDGGGGGIHVDGTFIMKDGQITNNTSTYTGSGGGAGGISVGENGNFTMENGTISNNKGKTGIHVRKNSTANYGGTFIKKGGSVTNNENAQLTVAEYGKYDLGDGNGEQTASTGGFTKTDAF